MCDELHPITNESGHARTRQPQNYRDGRLPYLQVYLTVRGDHPDVPEPVVLLLPKYRKQARFVRGTGRRHALEAQRIQEAAGLTLGQRFGQRLGLPVGAMGGKHQHRTE